MNKLLMLTFALSINFALSMKNDPELLDHKRNSIISLQNFCYWETGFTKEKHKLIRDTLAYLSDTNYYCYVGCYCTHLKHLSLFEKTLNFEAVVTSVTRLLSIPTAHHVINQCTNISTNSLCAAGREIHDCFAQNGVAIVGLIGYFDGDKN
ncbi:uncharacterized protein LOC106644966 [Copidosoma floridanum]|uniref:uncharacterized protein LOC106644966 n=1 Tax=Copidosoma floridanum TaxID=29053 RepID=UPI0006C9577D|nr:uncharacterized protein LOC106644966 [Copidosoma floridanum]